MLLSAPAKCYMGRAATSMDQISQQRVAYVTFVTYFCPARINADHVNLIARLMPHLINDPADFADEALAGLVAAHPRHVRAVHGGVVRARRAPKGEVAVVIGGGSGHYPAFAGWVGPGLAHGAACGNIFASPAASQVYSVIRATDRGAGVFVSFGNYAGDVLHFGQAADRARAEGIDVRILTVTDDVASSPASDRARRRGIAGDLAVFKVAAAAAANGASLDEVERAAIHANDRTVTLGVAFDGCTLPGADHPLFTVPEGHMSIGLGIHGEPGLEDRPTASANDIAELLVERLLVEAPSDDTKRITVLFNGLGTVKYEELFLGYGRVHALLTEAGYQIVEPLVGEQCTSLDMAGVSLTIMFLDEELEQLWLAPCDTPAYRLGSIAEPTAAEDDYEADEDETVDAIPEATEASQAGARSVASLLESVRELLESNEAHLGDLDAIAGDGDHGIGMVRGVRAAAKAAAELAEQGAGAKTTLARAGDAWAEHAGGTSGALWGAILRAVASHLDDSSAPDAESLRLAAVSAVKAVQELGGAQPGDKTMVDAMAPFSSQLEEAGALDAATWSAAVAAARSGAESTKDFVARLGRARTHAGASLGTPDPGAVSFTLIVERLGEASAELDHPSTNTKA